MKIFPPPTNTKVLKIMAVIMAVLTILLFVAVWLLIPALQKNSRLERNASLANQEIQTYRTTNGKLAYKTYVLEYSLQELKAGIVGDVIDELKNLGIKPKNITNFSETVIRQEKEIYTNVRDTVINDTIHASVFQYADQYYHVAGIKIGDVQKINISHVDSLIQVIYKGDRITKTGRKMPKWWIFTPRTLTQVIHCKDTTSKVKYEKAITIIK